MSVTFTDNGDKILDEFVQKKRKALFLIGEFVEGEAKEGVPVDTGNLRNSITHEEDTEYSTVGSAVSYSVFVETGTSRQKAQPYLKPAITENKGNIQSIVDKTFTE